MEYNRIADIKRLDFIIATFKQHLFEGAEVLDVGCGNGIIARGIGAQGYKVFGIDISEKAIAKAKDLTTLPNVNFGVISAEELIAEGKKYNAVVCSEVLEHLDHPEKLLATLYESLADDGVLIVTVPNGKGPRETLITKPMISLQKKNNWMTSLVVKTKKILGYKGTTIQSDADDLTHVQFFTKKTLSRLAEKSKFQIIKFGVTNFIDDVFPFSLFTKRVKVLQKIDAKVAETLPHQCAGSFVTVWKKQMNLY